jgi:hypothetical protein
MMVAGSVPDAKDAIVMNRLDSGQGIPEADENSVMV